MWSSLFVSNSIFCWMRRTMIKNKLSFWFFLASYTSSHYFIPILSLVIFKRKRETAESLVALHCQSGFPSCLKAECSFTGHCDNNHKNFYVKTDIFPDKGILIAHRLEKRIYSSVIWTVQQIFLKVKVSYYQKQSFRLLRVTFKNKSQKRKVSPLSSLST
jgi:hypothetical protein